jgi:electron transport complex protein RnfC
MGESGLVGMGGAGFPTKVKALPNPKMPKEVMIVNACECEPYITCDYRVMIEWTDQFIAGVRMMKKATGCDKCYIGIEDNKPKAIEILKDKVSNLENIEVTVVKTKYPQGGERQLISAVLNRIVPTGQIPPMAGIVVCNVSTAAALAEAVVTSAPLTYRAVTVSGSGVKNPGNFYVPLGTSAQELIEHAGGLTDEAVKIVLGGPMMGFAIGDMTTPTTKTTGSILALTPKEIGKAKFNKIETACIRCGRCLDVCPEGINPTKIAHAVKAQRIDVAEDNYISACMECGSCSYICPANIELTGHIKTGKILIARKKKNMPN